MNLQEHVIKVYQDSEMQEAIQELKQAESMFDNAENKYRADEAYHRMEAAKQRIQAIQYERGDLFVEKVARTPQEKQAV